MFGPNKTNVAFSGSKELSGVSKSFQKMLTIPNQKPMTCFYFLEDKKQKSEAELRVFFFCTVGAADWKGLVRKGGKLSANFAAKTWIFEAEFDGKPLSI